jgi:hypothetical protein
MAAAQWILWHGQTLFKLLIYDDVEETSDGIDPCGLKNRTSLY